MDLEKSPGRQARIARGSGTHPKEVAILLKTHKQFKGMMKKMSMMKGSDGNTAKQMQRNPKQAMQQLHTGLDPAMLQQMGGAENVMQMMQSMGAGGAGGGPNPMGAMMNMLGGGGGR